jgi:predicted transposase/invertase (TIGR01784 family)
VKLHGEVNTWRQTENVRPRQVEGATRSTFDIGRLVHDLQCRDVSEMYFDVLKKQVSNFKNSEEGRRYMCEVMERIEARGEARGEASGKREGKREGKRKNMLATAKRLLANGKLMLREIAECTGLSLAQVKKLQASMA